MKAFRNLIAAAALCAAGMAPAFAQSTTFTNGDFSTGDFTNWTEFGDVSIKSPTNKVAALTTASTDYQDDAPLPAGFNNNSGNAAVDFFGAADLAGVAFEDLDSAVDGAGAGAGAGESTYEGSAIRQDFFATAGDTLTVSFDWTFLSADTSFDDFAFLSINDTVVNFVNASSAPASSQFNGVFGDFDQVTWGWVTGATYTYTAATTGAVSLVLGLVDVGDASGTSELRVDNIAVSAVSAVPEPESYAMLLAGLAVMGGIAARRRQS